MPRTTRVPRYLPCGPAAGGSGMIRRKGRRNTLPPPRGDGDSASPPYAGARNRAPVCSHRRRCRFRYIRPGRPLARPARRIAGRGSNWVASESCRQHSRTGPCGRTGFQPNSGPWNPLSRHETVIDYSYRDRITYRIFPSHCAECCQSRYRIGARPIRRIDRVGELYRWKSWACGSSSDPSSP